MSEDTHHDDYENWDGEEERRTMTRRELADRRAKERRRKYWFNLLVPIGLSIGIGGVISWGVYVTHLTYGISAKYEESFVKHVQDQLQKDAFYDHRLELLQIDYSEKISSLRSDMAEGLREIRDTQKDMYKLLLKHNEDNKSKNKE
jgi:hypothetical protein